MYKLGQYMPGESLVHKRDPRVKLIAVIALSIIILRVSTIGLLLVSIIAIAITRLACLPPASVLRTLRPVLPFFLGLFLLYLFFTPGRPVPPFPIGVLQISYAGLSLGLTQVWKFLLLVVAASLLTMTTSPTEISSGMERLLRPMKMVGISSHDIAMLVSLALRFMPTLQDEIKNIGDAQLARGANFNPRRLDGKIKALGYLSIPLLLNLVRRSDELVDAMEARGYHPGQRSYLYEPILTRVDYVLMAATIVLTIIVLYSPQVL